MGRSASGAAIHHLKPDAVAGRDTFAAIAGDLVAFAIGAAALLRAFVASC